MEYTIFIGVVEKEMALPVIESLKPLNVNVFIGKGYPSFSKLVNDCILASPSEIVVFCSHRVRPTPSQIGILIDRIKDGYGVATLYRFGCFGFKKNLIRKIGFFDERFLVGGWEDNDFIIRLKEANIAYYEDESIEYHPGKSTWQHPIGKPMASQVHYNAKWNANNLITSLSHTREIHRMLPEVTTYTLPKFKILTFYRPWSDSHLLGFSSYLMNYVFKSKPE
jgi:GT2 family glycosyltransferase